MSVKIVIAQNKILFYFCYKSNDMKYCKHELYTHKIYYPFMIDTYKTIRGAPESYGNRIIESHARQVYQFYKYGKRINGQ